MAMVINVMHFNYFGQTSTFHGVLKSAPENKTRTKIIITVCPNNQPTHRYSVAAYCEIRTSHADNTSRVVTLSVSYTIRPCTDQSCNGLLKCCWVRIKQLLHSQVVVHDQQFHNLIMVDQ